MMLRTIATIAALASAASAYQTPTRRAFVSSAATAAVAAVAGPALALDACPPKSSNCILTTWTPPSGTSASDAASALKSVIESYPQEGQNKADLGGWTLAEDNWASNAARYEFKSGIGNFAKFLNGGKPFIDDLRVEVDGSGVAAVRSSSRIGESDLGVNQKRLNYLVAELKSKGWSCPEPKY